MSFTANKSCKSKGSDQVATVINVIYLFIFIFLFFAVRSSFIYETVSLVYMCKFSLTFCCSGCY